MSTPEQEKTKAIVNRIISVVLTVMASATVGIIWAALIYRFALWAF